MPTSRNDYRADQVFVRFMEALEDRVAERRKQADALLEEVRQEPAGKRGIIYLAKESRIWRCPEGCEVEMNWTSSEDILQIGTCPHYIWLLRSADRQDPTHAPD